MRVILFACVAIAGIAVGANFVLDSIGLSTQDQTVSPSVRIN